MTAEEFIDQEKYDGVEPSGYFHGDSWDFFEGQMVRFAEYHVEQALKKASEKFDADCNKYAVLNAYPLENIK